VNDHVDHHLPSVVADRMAREPIVIHADASLTSCGVCIVESTRSDAKD